MQFTNRGKWLKQISESLYRNEDDEKVFVRNMSTGNSYYINKSSFDKDKHEIIDDSQQSNTDASSTSLVFEIHGLLKRQKSLEMEVQRYKKIYDDAIKSGNKQKADKANEMYDRAKKSLDTVKSEIQAKKSLMK